VIPLFVCHHHGQNGTGTDGARYLDLAAVSLNHLFDYAQAKTTAAFISTTCLVHAIEAVENVRHITIRNSKRIYYVSAEESLSGFSNVFSTKMSSSYQVSSIIIPEKPMKRKTLTLCTSTLTVGVLLMSLWTANASGPSGYHLAKKATLGGEGGWDYLYCDSKARRIYISRGTHVMVVDADSATVVGDIPNTNGVHGIAIADDLDKGFISDGRDGNVTIFDTKTLKVLATAPAGKNPDAIIYDPASKRVFAFNGTSKDTTAIDAKTGVVAGTIALAGKPEFAAADGKGHVFVNIEDTSEIVKFDANKLAVESRWKIAPGEEPSGLAMDRKHRRLFSVCSNKMMVVVNADNGQVITTLPTGAGTDAAGFDPETEYAFASNGEGTLTVVHEDSPDKFSVVENVPTQARARTMTLDAKTHQVYLVSADFGQAPAPTAQQPRPRPPMVPGSFALLIMSR
jgi:DNA-binding beta-propeller fold protein YncE